ncbi:acetylglutamate kinase [Lutispora saccharofermentans]|uniref:Acetylglutamate kinase n=1 Tax=Lutispora saccharofermentans TaxID=3024236 RepID=A0ABT1NAG6_9FIRM|nr:acetylglutamate kinase [Lutispora saccharofermentans]MCQ1528245.1 acetylglutamate kinase [Lutispora saccharofermentans]
MENSKKAEILAKALPYMQQHKGKTIVVKYGGNAMINQSLKEAVINDLVLMKCIGINLVVVHGGGPEINDLLKRINKESKFINGLRYTDKETMDIVQMVLAGKINKDLTAMIYKKGGKAIGLCGVDGNMLQAKKLEADDDLGFVGEISKVDTDIINSSINAGYIPVISSIALGEDKETVYNINADTAASSIASSLNAEKLILLTDVPGILTDPSDPSTLISQLDLNGISQLTSNGVLTGGMIPKVKCCSDAIKAGVKGAHIIDGRVKHSLLLELFTDEGIGTMIK